MPLLSNDPDQMTIFRNTKKTSTEFRREQKKATHKYYEFETRIHADYTRKLQKVLFIYILPLSFGRFQTHSVPYHFYDNVIFGSYPIFEFSLSMQKKCETRTTVTATSSTATEKNCNRFFDFFLSQ